MGMRSAPCTSRGQRPHRRVAARLASEGRSTPRRRCRQSCRGSARAATRSRNWSIADCSPNHRGHGAKHQHYATGSLIVQEILYRTNTPRVCECSSSAIEAAVPACRHHKSRRRSAWFSTASAGQSRSPSSARRAGSSWNSCTRRCAPAWLRKCAGQYCRRAFRGRTLAWVVDVGGGVVGARPAGRTGTPRQRGSASYRPAVPLRVTGVWLRLVPWRSREEKVPSVDVDRGQGQGENGYGDAVAGELAETDVVPVSCGDGKHDEVGAGADWGGIPAEVGAES